jgi:hypothetical protein
VPAVGQHREQRQRPDDLITPGGQRSEAVCLHKRSFIDRGTELAVIRDGYGASMLFPAGWQIIPDRPVAAAWSVGVAALLLIAVRGVRRRRGA